MPAWLNSVMYSTFPAISGDGDRDDDRDEDLLIVKEKCYPLDRYYFLGSFSLEMFLRMFLNFNNGNLITFKLHIDKIRQ